MSDTTNVIDVDFGADSGDLRSLALKARADLEEVAAEVADFQKQHLRYEAWRKQELAWARHQVRKLEEQLRAERRAAQPVTREAVLEGLRRIYRGQPVLAREVATSLFTMPPLHSTVVRVGLELRRLAEEGDAVRIPGDYATRRPNRWAVA